jgi:hypothetical protein
MKNRMHRDWTKISATNAKKEPLTTTNAVSLEQSDGLQFGPGDQQTGSEKPLLQQ